MFHVEHRKAAGEPWFHVNIAIVDRTLAVSERVDLQSPGRKLPQAGSYCAAPVTWVMLATNWSTSDSVVSNAVIQRTTEVSSSQT